MFVETFIEWILLIFWFLPFFPFGLFYLTFLSNFFLPGLLSLVVISSCLPMQGHGRILIILNYTQVLFVCKSCSGGYLYHIAILWPLISLMGLVFSLLWIWAPGESAFDIPGFLSILLSSGALPHDPRNPVLCSFAHMADCSGTMSRLEIKGMSALSFDSGHDIGSGERVGTQEDLLQASLFPRLLPYCCFQPFWFRCLAHGL